MSELTKSNRITSLPFWARATAVGGVSLGVALGAGGCGAGSSGESAAPTVANQTPGSQAPSGESAACPHDMTLKSGACAPGTHSESPAPDASSKGPVHFIFNAECLPPKPGEYCTSTIIVYADPSDTSIGRQSENGQFPNGDATTIVECHTTGRTVERHPDSNEYSGESNVWYRIIDTRGDAHYATAAYGAPDRQDTPQCP